MQPYLKYTYATTCEEMNYCVRCGVWQAALSPCNSYLLRDAICSSERPPSSSFIINNLSWSSFGCTGKLWGKYLWGRHIISYTHTHTHKRSVLSNTWNKLSWQQLFPPAMKNTKRILKTKGLCAYLPLSTRTKEGQMHADLHCYKTWIDGNFILPNKPGYAEVANIKKEWIMGAVAAGIKLITATYSYFDWVAPGSRAQLQC